MAMVTIDGHQFRIRSWQRDGRWSAYAVRLETGDRHGPDTGGATQEQAVAAAIAWLEWQAAHGSALAALQEAERAYHRTVAEAAFAADAPAAGLARRAALDRLQQRRQRLDALRESRPTPGREVKD